MLRLLLVTLKRCAIGLIIVAFSLGGLELGLRMAASPAASVVNTEVCDNQIMAPSAVAHHSLNRRREFLIPDPDSGRLVRLVTNSYGLRGREPKVPKPPGVFRVVCLGDEAILGLEVEESDSFPARLQQILQSQTSLEVDVINAGVPGYCPLLSYLQVRHQLLALQPDLLILSFDMSDVADDYYYRRRTQTGVRDVPLLCQHPSFARTADFPENPLTKHVCLAQWCEKRLLHLWAETSMPTEEPSLGHPQARYDWVEDTPPDWSMHIGHAFAPIEHLQLLADGIFARLLVTVHPLPWQVSATASDGDGVRAQAGVKEGVFLRSRLPFEALRSFLGEHRIAFCDASSAFLGSEEPDRLFRRNDRYFSEDGHALYAQVVAQSVSAMIPQFGQSLNRLSRQPESLQQAPVSR